MRRHFGHGFRGYPVQRDDDRRVAVDSGPQCRPWNRVGVPGGGRDEDPQIGRRHQHAGHLTVGRRHRVEVGSIEKAHAGGDLVDGNQT